MIDRTNLFLTEINNQIRLLALESKPDELAEEVILMKINYPFAKEENWVKHDF